jgi:hypothetical protein
MRYTVLPCAGTKRHSIRKVSSFVWGPKDDHVRVITTCGILVDGRKLPGPVTCGRCRRLA